MSAQPKPIHPFIEEKIVSADFEFTDYPSRPSRARLFDAETIWEYIPLRITHQDKETGTVGVAEVGSDGRIALHDLTVGEAARVMVECWRGQIAQKGEKEPLLCPPWMLRALCGVYPDDEQTVSFWETVRCMMREETDGR